MRVRLSSKLRIAVKKKKKKKISCSSGMFPCLVQYCKPWMTAWDSHGVPLVMLEALPRSREKLQRYKKSWVAWYVVYIEVCSCGRPPFQDWWIQYKDHRRKRKGNHRVFAAATPAGTKILHICEIPFYLLENAAFMWVQGCCKKVMPVDSIMIREKAKLLYDKAKGRWKR